MLLLAACTVMPYHRPPDTSLLVAPPAAAPAVDVSGLLGRLDALLAATSSVDVRDRLVELRELVLGAASGDPALRARVLQYAERALAIEERSSEQTIPAPEGVIDPVEAPVVEEELVDEAVRSAGPMAAVEAAAAAGRWEEALSALGSPMAGEDASVAALRKRCADGWAKAEREAAAADFIRAVQLPAGPARVAAVAAVKERLEAVNRRFPDNAVADEVRRHLATVAAEQAKP